ncbi:MAG: alpha/beta fold hydrolase, partial [Planctomycetota bacterium]
MTEHAYQFGPLGSLTGILNYPDGVDPEAPVAIILNAGIVHRVGPFRLHVDLARALASRGVASLRMDLSGLGDSETRRDLPEGVDRAKLDVDDAMSALEESHDIRQFVLIGLCSGAYNAHQVCVADPRVVGGVFMDGVVFETPEHKRRMLKRRLRYRFLRNAVKKRLDPNALHSDENSDSAEFFTNDKPAWEIAGEVEAMLRREMQLLF